ncbi:chaperone protein DNAJ [Angomonas deanei]|uniref:DnaJ domain containing protein, putative n=1 Tax=Angomonas deanei TaxID=59799 RepID=A0A7G2CAK4_9TRYP|nr:chaperone protein DNAJ [Angomonas deanei]CAD2215052.1 DnaJ domain containing protein, putative [Angomonas deanei]|eukprot:EPY36780.1 chaperone protein DNAJ [Angomonas deanei]
MRRPTHIFLPATVSLSRSFTSCKTLLQKKKEEEPHMKMIYSSHFVRNSGDKHSFGIKRYQMTKEEEVEQDKLLEEEEFAYLQETAGEGYYYLPFLYKVSLRAGALEKEKERIRFILQQRKQLTIDRKGGSVLGTPTRPDKVLANIMRNRRSAAADVNSSSSKISLTSPPTEAELFPYANWRGTCASLLRPFYTRQTAVSPEESGGNTSLATLTEDVDFLRKTKKLYAVNYYSRMHMVPKKHILSACYTVCWNAAIGVWNAAGSVICFTVRGIRPMATNGKGEGEAPVEGGVLVRAAKGFFQGCSYGCYFLYVGVVVSPVLHLPLGLVNTVYCCINFFTSNLFFDALSGRFQRVSVIDHYYFRRELQLRKRLIRAVGRQEFQRRHMKSEKKWEERMAAMGFSLEEAREKLKEKIGGKKTTQTKKKKAALENPYTVLNVSKNATAQQVKKQYKKLAMVYHPDVVSDLPPDQQNESKRKFQEISTAYQVLSNPEKRRAYDRAGASGLEMHETQHGAFASRTPEEIVQGIFGGEGFKLLFLGEVYRSHWSLRMEAQVNVSIAELEELQTIRTRQMAVQLASILDVHAKRPTTPYVPRNAPAAKSRVVHKVQMSGLPDTLFQSRGHRGATAQAKTDGAKLSPELKEEMLKELGDTGSKAAMSKPTSPFELTPGSNDYNCFSRDFEDRVDKMVDYLCTACFGPELAYELGEAYIVAAQRFLHIRPFYSTKLHVLRKIGTGMDRIFDAFTMKAMREKDADGNALAADVVARKMMAEYITMEFDSVVADMNVILKNVTQIVCNDCGESDPDVLKKRAYALWYLGDRLMKKGKKWAADKDDVEMMAYLQQAATSIASTSRPPEF